MSQFDDVKRLCLFAHFDRDNIVDEYVLFYLQDLRKVAEKIVFISTSRLNSETISALKNICDSVIIRKNVGYDFASWQAALKSETLKDFDELILCNDSVYGPLFPLGKIFSEMKERECDFWGITSNYDIAYHLQSYFIVFRKTVFSSGIFKKFWEGTAIPVSKDKVIKHCEVGLSQTLLNAGFKASTYVQYRFLFRHAIVYRLRAYLTRMRQIIAASRREKMLQKAILYIMRFVRDPINQFRYLASYFRTKIKAINVTHFFWKQLVLYYKMPFIKVDLLRNNPMRVNIDDYPKVISLVSGYNVPMITAHLSRVRNGSKK